MQKWMWSFGTVLQKFIGDGDTSGERKKIESDTAERRLLNETWRDMIGTRGDSSQMRWKDWKSERPMPNQLGKATF